MVSDDGAEEFIGGTLDSDLLQPAPKARTPPNQRTRPIRFMRMVGCVVPESTDLLKQNPCMTEEKADSGT